MISTGVFTRLGHTYRGRMVNVIVTNDKRRARAARLVAELGRTSVEVAEKALGEAGGGGPGALLIPPPRPTASEGQESPSRARARLQQTLTPTRPARQTLSAARLSSSQE